MRRSLPKVRIAPALRNPPIQPRSIHVSAQCSSAFALDPSSSSSSDTKSPRELLRELKFADLTDSLARETPNPSRAWAYYVDLLNYLEFASIPLQIHQAVLRKCVPTPAVLRSAVARRMLAGNVPRLPHLYESRLKTVMRNIRMAGQKPTLDDYHFILEQFASVGHHTGALQVYKELVHVFKLEPTPKTFGLCLQAIAHRLTLPTYKAHRPGLLLETSNMCRKLLQEMTKYKLPLTSVNLDLTVRVLKETVDKDAFSQLMKMGYGIDLDFPDHPPLDRLQVPDAAEDEAAAALFQTRQPFSTAALNTTIDMLGRLGNVSKLVQTFEVLTQPLPPQAAQHFSHEFDDDEDDFGVQNPAATQPHATPHALPNTTSYNLLLKHVSRAGHATFARHYLVQAMRLDRDTDRALRSQMRDPPEAVVPPRFAINRGTLLPVFGEANRDKNMELLRWVGWVARQTLRRKRNDLAWYSRVQEEREEQEREAWLRSVSPDALSEPERLAGASQPPAPSPSASHTTDEPPPQPDVPSPPPTADPNPTPTPKPFSLPLHLLILQRDISEISAFNAHLESVLARNTQRVKERLGRRVWGGKSVYLLHEDARREVQRRTWTSIVNFRPERVRAQRGGGAGRSGEGRGRGGAYVRPGWLASQRGLATSPVVDRLALS
ncbi:hypothetical protein BV22DRAFT_1069713 [Leucogyrophana mollusca]|uniref:Uncharacterized protein n=1 Tax=Leucogyrophana mollusca TaxID=85980 RepID=A0ACB8BDK7_9AGAM|nr:hypothetical protein BV22DRAFT_1069713 [Leucogyrophana mollusca]